MSSEEEKGKAGVNVDTGHIFWGIKRSYSLALKVPHSILSLPRAFLQVSTHNEPQADEQDEDVDPCPDEEANEVHARLGEQEYRNANGEIDSGENDANE